MTEYLTLDDLLVIAADAIGNTPPVRDHGLLDAALGRPAAMVFGADAYSTLHTKAAALLHSLTTNHALVDGNKRLALLATYVFLDLNAHELRGTQDDAFNLIMAVADGTATEVEKIAELLVAWSLPK